MIPSPILPDILLNCKQYFCCSPFSLFFSAPALTAPGAGLFRSPGGGLCPLGGAGAALPLRRRSGLRPHQTVPAKADQVRPPRPVEGLHHQTALFRPLPLQKRPLKGLVVGALGHVHRLHGPGVQLRVPHAGGQGPRGGVEVLDLLRLTAGPVEKHRQIHRVIQRAARVAAHQVGYQILLQAVALVEALVLVPEPLVHVEVGLAHVVQHPGRAVLRSHLQLA